MNQEKIGLFIALCRKEKQMTQAELAERLGVTNKSISNWENARCMPDLALFQPLCQVLDITVNELLYGEHLPDGKDLVPFEENLVHTIEYSKKKVDSKNKIIYLLLLVFGLFICISAISVFPEDSSWGSIYVSVGITIFIIGVGGVCRKFGLIKQLVILLFTAIISIVILLGADYANVKINHVPPRFRYSVETKNDMMIYKTLFYDVYRMNHNTDNEYYIMDIGKKYSWETVPKTPFNRDKSGIDAISRYKNPYVGNNSNDGNLINALPLANYGYVFKIDSDNLGLIIDYHITDWYINEDYYLEKSLLYNSVSLFALIDNVCSLTFNFSGNSYRVLRQQIEELYPDYDKFVGKKIHKDKFNQYVENKMNDNEFVHRVFATIFTE